MVVAIFELFFFLRLSGCLRASTFLYFNSYTIIFTKKQKQIMFRINVALYTPKWIGLIFPDCAAIVLSYSSRRPLVSLTRVNNRTNLVFLSFIMTHTIHMERLPATNRWFLFNKKKKTYTQKLQQEQNRNKTKVMPAIAKFKLLECTNNNEFVIIYAHKETKTHQRHTQKQWPWKDSHTENSGLVERFGYKLNRHRVFEFGFVNNQVGAYVRSRCL